MNKQLNSTDKRFLNLALNLAKKNHCQTKENPSVGCVIVKNNTILSTAVTAKKGRPHAEQIALNKLNNNITDATLYVSLEPCSHFGQTPPCTDAITNDKIKKVIIATKDPDLRVNNNGIEKLQQKNIQVILANCQKTQNFYQDYFTSRVKNRSFVSIKIATSLDGKIACKNYQSKWITNQKTRNYTNFLRYKHNAILVGANTLIQDNPNLDCRIKGLEQHSDTVIILTNQINKINPNLNIFKKPNRQIIIATSDKKAKSAPILRQLTSKIIICQENTQGLVDINDLLQQTAKIGINSILVEGGRNIVSQFIKNNQFDQLIHAQSNKIIGNDGINFIDDLNLENINDAIDLSRPFKIKQLDDDLIKFYKNPRNNN